MYRLALILLGVFAGAFVLCVTRLIMKEGLTLPDAFTVVVCAYTRIFKAFLSGRFNVHAGLAATQCMSDKL
jgi:hypothetical protein